MPYYLEVTSFRIRQGYPWRCQNSETRFRNGRYQTTRKCHLKSVGKVKDVYRRVLYLKHENYDLLVRIKDRLEEYIEINSGFRKVNIQFDFHKAKYRK